MSDHETPAMVVERVPLSDLHLDPANVRRHPERNKATIRASLTRFGPGRSLVLDGKNVVRAGNGTLEQAAEAGINEVLVVEPKPNQLVAVRRPDWSPSEATAYAIADNRSAELAEWDDVGLAEQLESLQAEDLDIEAIGFSEAEVEEMLGRLIGPSESSDEVEGKEYDESIADEVEYIECPSCHHKWPK